MISTQDECRALNSTWLFTEFRKFVSVIKPSSIAWFSRSILKLGWQSATSSLPAAITDRYSRATAHRCGEAQKRQFRPLLSAIPNTCLTRATPVAILAEFVGSGRRDGGSRQSLRTQLRTFHR